MFIGTVLDGLAQKPMLLHVLGNLLAYTRNSLSLYRYIGKLQRDPALRAFWDLEKTVLHEICVSGSPNNAKIPHLHAHKQKNVVVESVLVIFV